MTGVQSTILLHPDPKTGARGVTVPALPGCVTQGASREEAPALAEDAVRLHLAGLLAEGAAVPEEDAALCATRAPARRWPGRARRPRSQGAGAPGRAATGPRADGVVLARVTVAV